MLNNRNELDSVWIQARQEVFHCNYNRRLIVLSQSQIRKKLQELANTRLYPLDKPLPQELRGTIDPILYTMHILKTDALLYAGVCNEGNAVQRIGQHKRGRRGGDMFSVLYCDHIIYPKVWKTSGTEELLGVDFDYLTGNSIRENCGFRFIAVNSIQEAKVLEEAIKAGWLDQPPLLNPSKKGGVNNDRLCN